MAECENFEVVEMHRRQSHKERGELHAALEDMKAIGKPGKYAINERTDAGVGDTDNYLFSRVYYHIRSSYRSTEGRKFLCQEVLPPGLPQPWISLADINCMQFGRAASLLSLVVITLAAAPYCQKFPPQSFTTPYHQPPPCSIFCLRSPTPQRAHNLDGCSFFRIIFSFIISS